MECSNCGVSGDKMSLFDVISGEGIVKLCEDCLSNENVPLTRPKNNLFGVERKQSNYERLSRLKGLNPEEHKKNVFGNQNKELEKQEVNLRDLVDKKFEKFVKEDVKKRDDLIDNFHWIIMRARRAKKWSISRFASEINEPERVLKMAEQGIMPDGYDIVNKFETVLGINILKPEVKERLKNKKRQLGFDDISTKTITISDLKEMSPKDILKQTSRKTPYWRRFVSGLIRKRENKKEEDSGIFFEEVKNLKTKQIQDVSDVSLDDSGNINEDVEAEEFEQVENNDAESAESEETPVQIEDTSFEMTTSFSGDEGDDNNENVVSKDKKELSQKEIDDLIFGRE